jgi:hypothetical protein
MGDSDVGGSGSLPLPLPLFACAQCSVLGAQCSVLSARCSVLGARARALARALEVHCPSRFCPITTDRPFRSFITISHQRTRDLHAVLLRPGSITRRARQSIVLVAIPCYSLLRLWVPSSCDLTVQVELLCVCACLVAYLYFCVSLYSSLFALGTLPALVSFSLSSAHTHTHAHTLLQRQPLAVI